MKKVLNILKWIGVGLVILFLGWLAYFFSVNIGGLISSIFGTKKKRIRPITNKSGERVGSSVPIVIDNSPLRDTSAIKLETGEEIQLPKGVKDSDVEKVTVVGSDYTVWRKHENLSDVFDG